MTTGSAGLATRRNREVCVEICDADAVNADPSHFDDDPNVDSTGRDLEESLDEMI